MGGSEKAEVLKGGSLVSTAQAQGFQGTESSQEHLLPVAQASEPTWARGSFRRRQAPVEPADLSGSGLRSGHSP